MLLLVHVVARSVNYVRHFFLSLVVDASMEMRCCCCTDAIAWWHFRSLKFTGNGEVCVLSMPKLNFKATFQRVLRPFCRWSHTHQHLHVIHILVARIGWQRLKTILTTNNQPYSLFAQLFLHKIVQPKISLALPLSWYMQVHTRKYNTIAFKRTIVAQLCHQLSAVVKFQRSEKENKWNSILLRRFWKLYNVPKRTMEIKKWIFVSSVPLWVLFVWRTVQCTVHNVRHAHTSCLPTLTLSSHLTSQNLLPFLQVQNLRTMFR